MASKSEIDILTSFDSTRPQTAAEIIKATGLPRSTAFRALRLLVDARFLEQRRDGGKYVLGPRMLQLGLTAREQLAPQETLAPPLFGLSSMTQETVTFSLVDAPWRLCVFVLDAPSELRSVAQVGSRYALHLGAGSQVLLANLPEQVAVEALRFHGVPEHELPARLATLADIRTAGAATSTGERVIGASSVAAAVYTGDNLLGSVAVAGPTERVAPRLDQFRAAVIDTARVISTTLTNGRSSRAVSAAGTTNPVRAA